MDDERVVFRKSGMRMAFDGCLLPVGAVLFLGMAVLLLFGALGVDPLTRLIGAGMFGFFGVFMASGAVTLIERGTVGRVADVGPDGIWLPEMGRLPWSALAEVRLEILRGVGGNDATATVAYRRLGVVPRDPTIRPSGATTAGWAMAGAFVALVRRLDPRVRLGIDDPAPFGAGEPELGRADFERLLEVTRRYVTVIDAAERRARERAPRWSSTASASSPGAPTVAEISSIDARLAPARASETVTGSPTPVAATVRTGEPRASFRGPSSSVLGIVGRLVPGLIPIAFLVGVPLVPDWSGGDLTVILVFFVLWVTFFGAFLVVAARPFVAEVRRWRANAAESVSLEVGPEGIRMPPDALIPWNEVAQIRTERGGVTEAYGGVEIERWLLVVVRSTGSPIERTSTVGSDRIDDRFDDVLDLVRYYHPVDETG